MFAAAEAHTPGHVLGPRRLVVEVPRPVVGGAAADAAVLQQVDQEEGAHQVAVAEDQVLVELDAALAVQVDVEQLAVPQRLRDAVREVQPGHLLVADLGVQPDHLVVLQAGDEGQRVADGRQQDVAARLVRLRLQREPDAVAVVAARSRPACRRPRGSGRAPPARPSRCRTRCPRARPTSRRCARRAAAARSMLRITLRSANRRTARSLLVNPPSLNTGWVNRFVVIIGTTRPVSFSAAREPVDVAAAGRVVAAERDQVVVVEGDAVGAELGQLVHRLHRVERRPRRRRRTGRGPASRRSRARR